MTRYKHTFVIHNHKKLIPIPVEKFVCFYIKKDIVYGYTIEDEKYPMDFSLEDLNKKLNPDLFFRANRQQIINRMAVKEVEFFYGRKLAVVLKINFPDQIIISKARVDKFKLWLDN